MSEALGVRAEGVAIAPPPLWLRAAPFAFLLLWSNGFVFMRLAIRYADPLTLLSARYALALCVLLPAALILRPRWPARREWGPIVVVGVLVQCGYFGCAYSAGEMGMSAGAVALITSLQPVLVGLLVPSFAHERVSAQRWLGLALGLAGGALVIVARAGIEPEPLAGIGLAVGALLSMTTATLWEKRYGRPHHPVPVNVIQYAVGVAVLLPLAALIEPMRFEPTWPLAGALAYLVIGNSIVALTLLLAMIRAGEAASVSALFFLIPPISAVFAWLLLGEPIPPLAWAGMALASAGVWLAVTRRRVM